MIICRRDSLDKRYLEARRKPYRTRSSPSVKDRMNARVCCPRDSIQSGLGLTGRLLSMATTIPCSRFALAENGENVPGAVKDADNVEWSARGIVHNDAVRKGLDCPKPKRKLG